MILKGPGLKRHYLGSGWCFSAVIDVTYTRWQIGSAQNAAAAKPRVINQTI